MRHSSPSVGRLRHAQSPSFCLSSGGQRTAACVTQPRVTSHHIPGRYLPSSSCRLASLMRAPCCQRWKASAFPPASLGSLRCWAAPPWWEAVAMQAPLRLQTRVPLQQQRRTAPRSQGQSQLTGHRSRWASCSRTLLTSMAVLLIGATRRYLCAWAGEGRPTSACRCTLSCETIRQPRLAQTSRIPLTSGGTSASAPHQRA
mmetsp:Transcript_124915/g.249428  ORF Transcript_124915/g.249428 Transcript_124915/m.249428 type:complete len:201 (+) Transcript_124915:1108-1710(+)